ncbi:polysaccharide biosynthesis protein [Prosthecochloris aestuarii DSM 271]|uniref:Polysaccharide biosynthesis protein n=1 Tax=Prosthecochloris aestuarii (strain DSM 271 / SK 413) TaxID=290512 RepID=B4S4W5_PROA2|nr:oligosaccharide flippase family protein [Prosthecochloris aestuarii]ACF45463.1 polysaccharide biosynthesis protein [Prosthecochloris aestuarii DSM 271]
MLDKLRLLAKDTVIYGTSTILARGLNYVLVPLYANLLTTFENGIQALIYANIALANVLFAYGMETSYLKSASEALRQEGGSSRYFSTAFLTLLLSSTLFAAAIVLFAPWIAVAIGLGPGESEFIRYAAVILWLDALLVVPFADLRLKRHAIRFAAARVTGVITVVICAWGLIVGFETGLKGAFLANIAGSLVSFLFVLPVFSQFRAFFSASMLKEMLRIGLPYVPTGIAGLLIHLIDRNILIRVPQETLEALYGNGYTPSDIVGIYGRVAAFGILLQLFIQVFRFAWQPFFLQHADDPEAKTLFRHVLSLSTLFTMLVALCGTFFVPDIVRYHYGGSFYLLPPVYWMGLSILPWIFCSYIFDMISTNLTAGILITGSTRYLPLVTFAGAGTTTAVCLSLVPSMGMDGAAVAILAGTVVMCGVMAFFALKVYPNRYEWGRLLLLFLIGICCAFVPSLTGFSGLWPRIVLVACYMGGIVAVFRHEAGYAVRLIVRKVGG